MTTRFETLSNKSDEDWRMTCSDPIMGDNPVIFQGEEVHQILSSVNSSDVPRLYRTSQLHFAGEFLRVPGADKVTVGLHMLHQAMLSAHFARQLHGEDARDKVVEAYLNGFNSDRSKRAGGHLVERALAGDNKDRLADDELSGYLQRVGHNVLEIEKISGLLKDETYLDGPSGAEDTDRHSYRRMEVVAWDLSRAEPAAVRDYIKLLSYTEYPSDFTVDADGKHLVINSLESARVNAALQRMIIDWHWLNPLGMAVELSAIDMIKAVAVFGSDETETRPSAIDYLYRNFGGFENINPRDSLYVTDHTLNKLMYNVRDERVKTLYNFALRASALMLGATVRAFPALVESVTSAHRGEWNHFNTVEMMNDFLGDGWKTERSSPEDESGIEAGNGGIWFKSGSIKPRYLNPHTPTGRLTDEAVDAGYHRHFQDLCSSAEAGFRIHIPFGPKDKNAILSLNSDVKTGWLEALERPSMTDDEFLACMIGSGYAGESAAFVDGSWRPAF